MSLLLFGSWSAEVTARARPGLICARSDISWAAIGGASPAPKAADNARTTHNFDGLTITSLFFMLILKQNFFID
jgi:hypothetical protein